MLYVYVFSYLLLSEITTYIMCVFLLRCDFVRRTYILNVHVRFCDHVVVVVGVL